MDFLDISEEKKREIRDTIPRGEYYPKTYRKGQPPTKTSYYKQPAKRAGKGPVKRSSAVSVSEKPRNNGRQERRMPKRVSFAHRLIRGIPDSAPLQAQREYWERELLRTYYHLYGIRWSQWKVLIPWRKQEQLHSRAALYGCDHIWNWMDKRRFLQSHGFGWDLRDFDYLIDWYPDRQKNAEARGIYVGNRPVAEINAIASALDLPTSEDLSALASYARTLNDNKPQGGDLG